MFTVNSKALSSTSIVFTFQNISCLRLINNKKDILKVVLKFQNISCLRLIRKSKRGVQRVIRISKHFMFTVNFNEIPKKI